MEDIDRILEEILTDAYGDAEQLTAFEVAFTDRARFPFAAQVVGTQVEVIDVTFEGDQRRGLTAICRRDGDLHHVSLVDLIPGPVTMETSRLLTAYRRWLGLPDQRPVAPSQASARARAWTYRRVADQEANLMMPLALRPMGMWDPLEQYWGEDDDERDPLIEEIILAGPRPEFEMEVIPGLDEDDWDSDPVADAAELHRFGHDREATRILKELIAKDERCIDAWVHLGNIAFDAKGPKEALPRYDRAVAMAEQSLPEHFNGVLPRGLIGNRPFLRALNGLGLCAWRQRRWDDAAAIFTDLAWIDGGSTWTSLACLHAVLHRERWSSDS